MPLESSLADDLRNYFSANPTAPNFKAIKGMWKKRGAEMLRKDLMAARINPKRASGKVIDFHGLRHTYGTMLAQAGVMPAHLKSLMRHSNVQLTMEYYTHLSIDDLNEEIAKISFTKSNDAEKSTIPEKVTTPSVKEPKEVGNAENVNICVTQCVTNNGKLTSFSGYGSFPVFGNVEKEKTVTTYSISSYGSNLVAPPAGLEPATHGLTELI